MSKFLDYDGLRYFKEKLDLEYDVKIEEAIEVALPTPDGETIVADANNVWSTKLPANGPITSDSNGLKLDLSKIAGDTIAVDNNKLEVVIDGSTIVKGPEDQTTHKYPLEVNLTNLADGGTSGGTIINNNDKLSVNLDNIIDSDTIINNNGKLEVDPSALHIPPAYTLPTASASVKGGVKIGNGLEMTGEVLAVKAANDTITVTASGIAVTPGKYAPLTEPGQGEAHGIIPDEYLPSYVDDVIEGYYNPTDGKFYESYTPADPTAEPPVAESYDDEITPDESKIYVDLRNANTYRYSGSIYVNISGSAIDIITDNEIDALFPSEEPDPEPEP